MLFLNLPSPCGRGGYPPEGKGAGGGMLINRPTFLAKQLRTRCTDTERLLWRNLRTKQIKGFKFRRQQPIGKYIVDFVCFEKKIIIEVDGGQHAEKDVDKERDQWLEKEGFKVLRFWNNEVLLNLMGVLEVIRMHVLKHHPHPSPPPSRGRARVGVCFKVNWINM